MCTKTAINDNYYLSPSPSALLSSDLSLIRLEALFVLLGVYKMKAQS